MAKEFSDSEKSVIREKLIAACEEYWSKYGYKKTSIKDLVEKVNISTGAFYDFFQSKEHLFFETDRVVAQRLVEFAKSNVPPQPTKKDFANRIKEILRYYGERPWLLQSSDEYELFLRRLPPDMVEQYTKREMDDYVEIAALFDRKPKESVEKTGAAFYILMMSYLQKEKITTEIFDSGMDALIDAVVNQFFY